MLSFPNCKINLGLHVVSKRSDGYHNLETVFFPLPFRDVVELVISTDQIFSFTCSGVDTHIPPEDNLCVKAYELLKKDFPQLSAIRMHLHKTIPPGAGLGGGSADAAFILRLLNNKFNLAITEQQLMAYALQLGSDCPFFILNRPCLATGRGEKLTPVDISLSGYRVVLVNPGIEIATARAFDDIVPSVPKKPLATIILQPPQVWKDELHNDFESATFLKYPEIAAVKNDLYRAGAVYASMSGSGSSVYGIFQDKNIPALSFPDHYLVKILNSQL